ncbi:ABC transporter ATP-binding protein [Leptotrichia sp. oral taxon 223]|uniref:ABC transporter ATP-binding protein n=1 Tax=Leptotrichia sp. oral taxon 223 TaxID=712363 RepID=UPI0015BA607B|nr:ABC transporter ATP-binding protein [Leptotrichia sp. oral taxon 223]NWO19321.1 ABC transporter ATP-binding protein [Leptotrichia sp. oral taxon 223]
MAKDVVISVKNVEKSFKIYSDKGHTLKERLLFFKQRNSYTRHEVLKGVTLEIEKGEVVGLVGHNGCGKSTLLKLMTKIIYSDKGKIEINGKISSLLELGAGFHPDMTGRENIYTNASIFGLTKKEIDGRLDEIIEFSELEEFIDSPVRTYSSGMYMRLAFSVAINVDADILLIDEILAVGDARFQAKCFNKMLELKKRGITIVIVSHDLGSIERLCNRAVWIENGKIKDEGIPHDIVAEYLDDIMNKDKNEKIKIKDQSKVNDQEKKKEVFEEKNIEKEEKKKKDKNRTGNKDIEIINIKLLNEKNEVSDTYNSEDKLKIKVKYKKNNEKLKDSVFGFGIFRNDGLNCYGTNTFIDNFEKIKIQDEGIVEVDIESIQLLEGKYYLDIAFHDEYGKPYDYIRKANFFTVYSILKDTGIFRINHKFSHL